MPLSEGLLLAIQLIIALIAAYLAALWLSLIVWTYRDIRARSKDLLVHIFSALLAMVFSLPGLLMYLALRPRETIAERYDRALEEEALLQDLEWRVSCPACKRAAQMDFLICPHCQTVLRQPCRRCGKALELSWRACPYCALVVAEALAVPSSGGRPEAVSREELYQSGNIARM